MIKKIYTISGFDCANCAMKAEKHLANQKDIEYAHIDFSTNKLYLTYKKDEWSIEQIGKVIAEVEGDPIFISEKNHAESKQNHVFTKKMFLTIFRIIFAVIVSLICIFLLAKDGLEFLRLGLYVIGVVVIGYDIFWKVILHIKNLTNILDHNLLISIAALGALTLAILKINEPEYIYLGNYPIVIDESMEAVMVITLFQIGSIIEAIATNKSKAAVMSAVELRVDTANLITEKGITLVKPEELNVGDHILITTGELIPIDGEVIDGEGYVDTSSLTGEFVPVQVKEGFEVFGGCLLKNGTLTIRVKKKYADSTVAKIIDLISSGSEKKSKADEFIAKFAKWYTPIVVILAILTFLLGGIITSNWMTWIHTGLEVLVIGCPCAIVISVPLAYFSAIGLASKKGIVIKGANYLDQLVNVGYLVTDKTGTLTHGSFSIQKVVPHNFDEDNLLIYLYAAECLSNHPIGKAICHHVDTRKLAMEQKNFKEIPGYGVETHFKDKHIYAGSYKFLMENNITLEPSNEMGTIIYCALDGQYIGYVVLSDEIKEDAQPMVDLLHMEKIKIVLLTGDNENNAKEICQKLGIDEWKSGLLPEEKTNYLVSEKSKVNKATAFIGDGINDAPSIIRSDVGIAMGGIGSDIAVENADVIIMNDDPAKVYDAIKIAKIARHTSIFNIVFALSIKLAVFILAIIFKDANFMMYVAILADTGLTVLMVINSLLILYRKVKRPKLH